MVWHFKHAAGFEVILPVTVHVHYRKGGSSIKTLPKRLIHRNRIEGSPARGRGIAAKKNKLVVASNNSNG